MEDNYHTIKKPTAAVLLKERKSKFYGHAFPIESETDINPILETIRSQYPTANHLCYAWQLGVEQKRYRVNDDGEPNNSAGMPIYGQLQSFDLTNVLVVVVRFFGGTKLGVGGLISAYKETAKLTLEQATIVEKFLEEQLVLKCEYPEMNVVMRMLDKYQMNLIKQELAESCQFLVSVRKSEVHKLKKSLKPYHKIQVEIK
ncbi:IMPACT family protein [Maribacter aestuarii]|uniref:IMPACT family protein n=1 Tax=Maribacter aestuarii TaxID=1130723 RepID=UPI003221876F